MQKISQLNSCCNDYNDNTEKVLSGSVISPVTHEETGNFFLIWDINSQLYLKYLKASSLHVIVYLVS